MRRSVSVTGVLERVKRMSTPKPKFTARFKGDPLKKECVDCHQVKHRLKDFKPRWGKCSEHRGTTKRGEMVKGCEQCDEARNSVVRQPRCIECDATRGKKKAAEKADTKVPAKKVAAKKVGKNKVAKKAPVVKVIKNPEPVEPITVTEEISEEVLEAEKQIEAIAAQGALETEKQVVTTLSGKDLLKKMLDDEDTTPSKADEADCPF